MYKTLSFVQRVCKLAQYYNVDIFNNDCKVYSLWEFYPFRRVWEYIDLKENPFCSPEWFSTVFWTVLLLVSLGAIHSILELLMLVYCCNPEITVWRRRKYYLLPYSLLTKVRLFGALLSLALQLSLCYAVITVSPNWMGPWIAVHTIILFMEIVTFVLELVMSWTAFERHYLWTFLLPFANLLFVRSVRFVFERADKMGYADNLRLW